MPRVKRWHSTAAAALCSYAGQDEPVSAVRRCADTLLANSETAEPPVKLELVASFRRIRKIEYVDMVEAGRLLPTRDAYVMQVNRGHAERKQRFTVGHEICHTFFDQASASARNLVDAATGLFDILDEEETYAT